MVSNWQQQHYGTSPAPNHCAYDVQPFVAWMQHFQSLILRSRGFRRHRSFFRFRFRFRFQALKRPGLNPKWKRLKMVIHLENLSTNNLFKLSSCHIPPAWSRRPLAHLLCWFVLPQCFGQDSATQKNSLSMHTFWALAHADSTHPPTSTKRLFGQWLLAGPQHWHHSLGPHPTRSPIAISLPLWDLRFSTIQVSDFSLLQTSWDPKLGCFQI